ncbi:hypothetical protein ACQ86K_30525 [Mucilaginibacter sp. P19]
MVLNLFVTNDGSVWSGTKQGISYFDENQKNSFLTVKIRAWLIPS